MKKLLVLAALTMAAAPAMASKARMTALGNAVHLIDTQTVFVNVADIHYLGDYATLEFGTTANNAGTTGNAGTQRAEGGFVRSSSMGKWGAYLGRQSATVNQFVGNINTGLAAGGAPADTLLTEQNPLDLFYGTDLGGMKWGFGLHYAAAKDERDATRGTREVNTLGFSAGVRNDVWDAYARIGLGGESKTDLGPNDPKLSQKGLYDVGFGMWFDSLYVSAKYLMTKGTFSNGTDTDIEKNTYSVNVIDNVKVDGGNFFYGASYASDEIKVQGGDKTTVTGMPVIVGMEIDAASWLVLRGSVTQRILVGENKTEPNAGTATAGKLVNDTVVAAGAGIKFAKITLDGTLAGATNGTTSSGNVSGNELLANGSLTYMF